MKKSNGFSLSEVIIAMGVLLMLVATAIPIHQKVTTEQYRMKHHQLIKHALHDDLQMIIWAGERLNSYERIIAAKKVQMSFTVEGDYVKGCAVWKNVREDEEKTCLYGIQEE